MTDERVLLGATVGPLAAAIIDREMGGDLRRRVRQLEALGQVESARQLSLAAAQLREAARQVDPGAGLGAASSNVQLEGSDTDRRGWLSTAEAARALAVTERQVRHLERGGRLRGVLVRRRWLFDPVGVTEEAQRRGRAPGET